MRLALILIVVASVGAPTVNGQTRLDSCPAPDTAASSLPVTLQPGWYRLTVIETASGQHHHTNRVEGTLRLWATSPTDRSPSTGTRAAPDSAGSTPFFGATDIAWRQVHAPLAATADVNQPASASTDPVYPGVLALKTNWDPHTSYVLTVGTVSNRRDGQVAVDGWGIGLWVQRALPGGGFSGTWKEWGRVAAGRGYYCAVAWPE